ncbi:MAG: hypothetical protein ABI239_03405, partial [Aquihabitans sp.]
MNEAWGDWSVHRRADAARAFGPLILLRYLCVATIAFASAVLGDFPTWTPIAVIVIGGGTTMLIHLAVHRYGRLPNWLPIVEILSLLAFPFISPVAVL